MKVFKDIARSDGAFMNLARGYAGTAGYLTNEADRVVDDILKADQNVFEELLTNGVLFGGKEGDTRAVFFLNHQRYHGRNNGGGKAHSNDVPFPAEEKNKQVRGVQGLTRRLGVHAARILGKSTISDVRLGTCLFGWI